MGCTASCVPILHENHPFTLWGLLPCYSADRLAHRQEACLLLLRQDIWSDNGNIAPGVNGDMTSVFFHPSCHEWIFCSMHNIIVFKFPVGAKLCLGSFSDPALGCTPLGSFLAVPLDVPSLTTTPTGELFL